MLHVALSVMALNIQSIPRHLVFRWAVMALDIQFIPWHSVARWAIMALNIKSIPWHLVVRWAVMALNIQSIPWHPVVRWAIMALNIKSIPWHLVVRWAVMAPSVQPIPWHCVFQPACQHCNGSLMYGMLGYWCLAWESWLDWDQCHWSPVFVCLDLCISESHLQASMWCMVHNWNGWRIYGWQKIPVIAQHSCISLYYI